MVTAAIFQTSLIYRRLYAHAICKRNGSELFIWPNHTEQSNEPRDRTTERHNNDDLYSMQHSSVYNKAKFTLSTKIICERSHKNYTRTPFTR